MLYLRGMHRVVEEGVHNRVDVRWINVAFDGSQQLLEIKEPSGRKVCGDGGSGSSTVTETVWTSPQHVTVTASTLNGGEMEKEQRAVTTAS